MTSNPPDAAGPAGAPKTSHGRGFRARLHARLWLLCLAATAVALLWQAALAPALTQRLQPWLPQGAFWVVLVLSTLLLGTALFATLRKLRPGRDDDLAARLRQQQQELQALAKRLIDLQESERRMLSRELHDDVGQAITAMKMGAGALAGEDEAGRAEIVAEMIATADQTIAKLRDLSMLLRPPQLDALGLEAALRWQAERLFRAAPTALELHLTPLPRRPTAELELACFRIAQEALTNVLRHAQADRVVVTLDTQGDEMLTLRIVDDGDGIAPDRIDGLGLLTMRERAQLVGGVLDIRSEPGAGTRIEARLPLTAR